MKPHSQAFQHQHLSLAVLMLVVLEGLGTRLIMIHFLQLVLWHTSLLTAPYVSGSYIFPVEVFATKIKMK